MCYPIGAKPFDLQNPVLWSANDGYLVIGARTRVYPEGVAVVVRRGCWTKFGAVCGFGTTV
jgi:hypothetical protein